MVPEHTAPVGAVLSGFTLFDHGGFLNISADEKADDFCFDWRIKASTSGHIKKKFKS